VDTPQRNGTSETALGDILERKEGGVSIYAFCWALFQKSSRHCGLRMNKGDKGQVCGHCGQVLARNPLQCSACRGPFYCNKGVCQKSHWEGHTAQYQKRQAELQADTAMASAGASGLTATSNTERTVIQETCTICLDPLATQPPYIPLRRLGTPTKLPCLYECHRHCIDKLRECGMHMNELCPQCRAPLRGQPEEPHHRAMRLLIRPEGMSDELTEQAIAERGRGAIAAGGK
jgi:hypothetical protein